ncbi:MAG: hypothetical protein CVU65_01910 [Deltaproteobacteria bacterium HGW-Deltaproteobacteria-22]|nr:MAG: hypothetical protein CVU65_01910 [Deltaproteobacteria bacterium HGW-Deltaproteobacteria-22]
MLTLLSLMLLSAPLDCGANLTLDVTPAGVSIRSGARAATFPAPAGFSPVRCTWAPAHGLLHAASDTAQWLFRVQWPATVTLARTGTPQDAHPWFFLPATGEIHQESPLANHCDDRPVAVNRQRWGKAGWEPSPHRPAPLSAGAVSVPAVKGPPPQAKRRPWFAAPPPVVIEPQDPGFEERPAPVRLIDHNATSAWTAESPGPGVTFLWSLPTTLRRIRAISVLPGNGQDEAAFARHARLRTFTVTAGGRTVRVDLPMDPLQVPGSLRIPWHVSFDTALEARCLEITVERVWPGAEPLAISELTIFTELDFSADPIGGIFAGIADRSLMPAQVRPALPGIPDARLLAAWDTPDVETRKLIAGEIARRPVAAFVPVQLEILAWADPQTVALLGKSLSLPHAREAIVARMRPDSDPAYLARLLPLWLSGGAPDPTMLLEIMRLQPTLTTLVRDQVREPDREALIAAWCPRLLDTPFVFSHWIGKGGKVRDAAVACLSRWQPKKDLRMRLLFLQAVAKVPDPRLADPVKRLLRSEHRPAVKLQALGTLLHLMPAPETLARLARTPRPDAQLVLLAQWPAKAPLLPELVALAKSPWTPVKRAALFLLSDRCAPAFADMARPVLADPADDLWYPLLERVKTCGYASLRPDLLKLFADPKLADEAFSTLAQLFAAKKEKNPAGAVAVRVKKFFSPKASRAFLEEHLTAGTWLLRALAAFERPADSHVFLELARRPLPEPYLETLFSILSASQGTAAPRCPRAPSAASRPWRNPAAWTLFLKSCQK